MRLYYFWILRCTVGIFNLLYLAIIFMRGGGGGRVGKGGGLVNKGVIC